MKKKDILFILGMSLVTVLALVGISYAYFSLDIQGEGKDMVVTTGDLRLIFTDGDTINLEDVEPGVTINKTITVENAGTDTVYYDLYWDKLENNIARNEMTIKITCESLNSSGATDGTCDGVDSVPIKLKNILTRVSIEPGYTYKYDVLVTFIDTGKEQNYNKNSSFSGKFGVKESTSTNTYNCYVDSFDSTQGFQFENGSYVYSYKQKPTHFQMENLWSDIDEDGWGVQLVNHYASSPITSKVCTTINGLPIVATSSMFSNYSGTADISTLDTSNVVYMDEMFYASKIDNLDLSNFDTSKVTTMKWMFYGNRNESLDLRSFDTSNVTDMESMFYDTDATLVNVVGFDTSKVTNMDMMFANSTAATLDLRGFDTSNITNMSRMFSGAAVNDLNIKYFDTSKVTNMSYMFDYANLKSLYLGNFDTSNVTNMSNMFANVTIDSDLDLSSFNTSKVTDMSGMFEKSAIDSIDLSSFDTSSVTNMIQMFYNSSVKTLDLKKFNTSNVTNMYGMFWNAAATTIDVSNFNTSNVTRMDYMFYRCSASVLDLSSFTLNDSVQLTSMFTNAKTTTGYAKDAATAAKFNDKSVTSINSDLLTFVVKS